MMIGEFKMKKKVLSIITILIFLFLFLGCTNIFNESAYKILADNEEHTTGRISYIDVKVVDKNNNPVSGVRVRFFRKSSVDASEEELYDVISGQYEVKTNEEGVAKIALLMEKSYDSLDIHAYVVDDPLSEVNFKVNYKEPKWFFIVWMSADNNLEDYGLGDLNEMKNNNENVSVIVFFDGKDEKDKILFLDENGNLYQSLWQGREEINSGAPNELFEALIYSSKFESKRRSLIIWNHGNAWVSDSQSYVSKGISYDETSGEDIAVVELKEVLEKYNGKDYPKIDLLGMDACLMGSFEVLYDLKDLTDYVVASSFPEPGEGWNYQFFGEIAQDDEAQEVGKKIIDTFKEYYSKTDQKNNELSLALYDMSKLSDASNYISLLGERLSNIMDDSVRNSIKSFYNSITQYYRDDKMGSNLLVDLNEFIDFIKNNINDPNIKSLSEGIQNSLKSFILYWYSEWHSEKNQKLIDYPVSIFIPENLETLEYYAEDYNTLEFTLENKWDEFLESFLESGDILK